MEGSDGGERHQKDEAEIRSIIADHVKAHHTKNLDLLLAHGGEGFVSFDLAPPLQNKGSSPKEARREIEAWFSTWKGPIGLEERDLVVTAGDKSRLLDVSDTHDRH